MDMIEMIKGNYMKDSLAKGIRQDSRALLDFRSITIRKGVMPNAEGSAQVDLGGTRVLAGVKLALGEPMGDTPKLGNLMVSGELLPLASADYETGPPSPSSIELARVTDRGIRAGECINLEDLFVEEDKVWSVFVDLYVLNYDGNLFDASTIAAMAALVSTRVPKLENGEVLRKEIDRKLKIDNVVASTTFAKIHEMYLLDPDSAEEEAASTRLSITTDGKVIRAMQKGLSGSWKPAELYDLMEISLRSYDKLKARIME